MNDLNERAAKALGWETRYQDLQSVNKKLSYYEKDSYRLVGLVADWQPTQDIRQAWMLVDKVIGALGGIDIRQDSRGLWDVGIWREGERLKKWHTSETAAEAITAACVEALEAQEDTGG